MFVHQFFVFPNFFLERGVFAHCNVELAKDVNFFVFDLLHQLF